MPYREHRSGASGPFVLLFVLLATWGVLTAAGITVRVMPKVAMAGASFRVTCRVTPNKDNCWLAFGIAGYATSGRQLEGEDAAETYSQLWDRVPCEATAAFCTVVRSDGKQDTAVEPITIGGCSTADRPGTLPGPQRP